MDFDLNSNDKKSIIGNLVLTLLNDRCCKIEKQNEKLCQLLPIVSRLVEKGKEHYYDDERKT